MFATKTLVNYKLKKTEDKNSDLCTQTFGVDDGPSGDRYDGETQILNALHKAVGRAQLMVRDDDTDHGPERRRQNGVCHAHNRHRNVRVNETVAGKKEAEYGRDEKEKRTGEKINRKFER